MVRVAKLVAAATWVLMVLFGYFLVPLFVPFGKPMVVGGMPWYFWWLTIWMLVHFAAVAWYAVLEWKKGEGEG